MAVALTEGDRLLVTGATGYIGGRLVPELLAAGYEVVCLARTPAKLDERSWRDKVEVVEGDVGDPDDLDRAMDGCRGAYYLVHSMDGEGEFADRDRRFARTFRDAAVRAGLDRIVYLGGLGHGPQEELSPHLRSRQEVGRILADGPVEVTELRAAIIIGSGSASFEMLRNLVEVLPIMTTPRWVETECQPIAIRDVLHYLVRCLGTPGTAGKVLEIGGPDVLTYRQMMQTYADVAGLRRRIIIPLPVLTPKLSSMWVGLVTPLPTGLGKPLVKSLINEVTVRDDRVHDLMPRDTLPFREALELALTRVQDLEVTTSWMSAELGRPGLVERREQERLRLAQLTRGSADEPDLSAEPLPTDPAWAGGTLLSDERESVAHASPQDVYSAVSGIGGERGWYAADLLWEVRGLIDVALGGIGTRRGRRHPDDLAVGDALDFWRVEALERPRLVRLRAEMRVPGEAWLEFRVRALDDERTLLEQRARFLPRGLWGRLYWLTMMPFHAMIFPLMVRRLTEASEEHREEREAAPQAPSADVGEARRAG